MDTPIIKNIVPADWTAQVTKIGKDLTTLADKADKIVVNLSGGNSKEATALINQHAKAIDDLKLKYDGLAASEAKGGTQKTNRVKMTMDEKVAVEALTRAEKVHAISVSEAVGAYARLEAELRMAKKEMLDMAAAGITSGKAFDTQKMKVSELSTKLNGIGASTNVMGKGMNNAYNSTYQMTQVMRELPNFAMDARIGFMSLSNNLPMLADGFKQLAGTIDQTTGKAMGMGYAWKTMLKSLLSFNTVMIIATTLMVMFGDKIVDAMGKMFKGEAAAGSFRKQMQVLNEVLKDGSTKQAISNIMELGVALDGAKEGTYDADAAVKKYNETLGTHYGKVTDVNKALAGHKKYADDYIRSSIAMAAATKVMDSVADVFIEKQKLLVENSSLKNSKQLESQYQKALNAAKALGQAGIADFNNKIKGTGKDSNSFYKNMVMDDATIAKMKAAAQEYNKLLFTSGSTEFINNVKGIINANSQIEKAMTTSKAFYNQMSIGFTSLNDDSKTGKGGGTDADKAIQATEIYNTEKARLIRELAVLEEFIGKETTLGVVNAYEDRMNAVLDYYGIKRAIIESDYEIAVNDANAIVDNEVAKNNALLKAKDDYDLAYIELTKDTNGKYAAILGDRDAENAKITDSEIKSMEQIAEAERRINEQREEEIAQHLEFVKKETEETYKEMAGLIKDLTKESIEAVVEYYAKQTEKQSEQLDKQKENELNRLDETALTEKALKKEQERINDEYQNKQDELAEKQKKRELAAFLLQQGLALAGVWIKYSETVAAYTLAEALQSARDAALLGAVGVAKALATYEPLKAAAGVNAGLNAAIILAQTIPAFAEGGIMDKTGMALVGDGSKHELLSFPDGTLQVTPNRPTVMELEKGTTIYPDVDKIPSFRDIEKRIIVNSIFKSEDIVQEIRTLRAEMNTKPRLIDQAKLRRQYRS